MHLWISVNVPHLNGIIKLDLSRVGKLTLTETGFRDYDSLKFLDISRSEITALKSSWFSKRTLESLDVSGNLLKAIKKEDTKFFDRLIFFNASSNEIKTLEDNTFLDSKRIEIVSLSSNELTIVQFINLMNIKQLYIRQNALKHVS